MIGFFKNKFLINSFFSLIFVFSLILLFSNLLRGIWIFELFVSFLHLVVLFSILSLLIASIYLFFLLAVFKKEGFTLKPFAIITVLLLFLTTLLSVYRVVDYGFKRDLTMYSTSESIRVGFFNKFYWNTDYEVISARVKSLKLDVVAMGEINEKGFKTLETFLGYRYTYYVDCDCKAAVNSQLALFSKYKLENLQTEGVSNAPFIQAKIVTEKSSFELFVVHPLAPITSTSMKLRNITLKELAAIVNKSSADRKVIVGDLNTTPWSVSYRNLLANIHNSHDAGKGFGLHNTWKPNVIGPQLDHIIVVNQINVKSFNVDRNLFSDHRLVWSELEI
jgi:endonuclease/exonuclease/phosphatase (EEP) superfamily protein YafD